MDDTQLDEALFGLGKNTPKPPASLVEAMVGTVKELAIERALRKGAAQSTFTRNGDKELTKLIQIKNPNKGRTL